MKEWLKSIFEDAATPGHASSKRIVFVMAGISLSIATIILTVATIYGKAVSAELLTVTGALTGLATYGYVGGLKIDRMAKKDDQVANDKD